MRLYLSQNCHISLARGKDGDEKGIEATFLSGINGGTKLEKTFRKESQKPLDMETEWTKDQAWNCLLEISDKIRRVQEMPVPDNR